MDDAGENCAAGWQQKLSLVLELIRKSPDSIVDDTSVEKLLSWLTATAADDVQRSLLLHQDTNVLVFLSNPPESLLSNTLCASFSLKLAGILAGCDEAVCKLLIDDGCLNNLFAGFGTRNCTYFNNAAVKCAFFDGFSSIVTNLAGFLWSASLSGLIEYAIEAFSDSSFYVAKAAISFLNEMLVATETHKANQKSREIKAVILKMFQRGISKCSTEEKCCYLDLLYQVFDFNSGLAWELLDSFGGVASFLLDTKGKHVKLLQNTSEVCHQIIQKGSEHNTNMCEEILRVSIQVAKIDIIHLFQHLSCIVSSNGLTCYKNVPEYWNKSIISLVILSILGEETGIIRGSFDEKPILAIDKHAMPEEFVLLFNELESIVKEKLNDRVIWRKCFTMTMDTCMEYFTKYQRETLGSSEKHLVQCWVLFLCEILELVSKDKEEMPAISESKLISCLYGHKYLTKKCIKIMTVILKNFWFQEFSTDALLKIIISLIQVLDGSTIDTQALSSIIQFFGSYINILNRDLLQIVFADNGAFIHLSNDCCFAEELPIACSKLPTLFEKLLLDFRWEIQDSVLDLLSNMVSNLQDSSIMENFLEREKFWLKSWKLLDADESYVRSATVRFIGLVQENKILRDVLFSSQPLERVLSKLFSVFVDDDEAFPKRSVIDVTYRWLNDEELMRFIMENEIGSERDIYEDQIWSFICKVLSKARVNFDWEVKMKGINCWAKILTYESTDSLLEKGEDIDAGKNRCLETVCRNEGSAILIHALDDCDRMVCECALATLHQIQSKYMRSKSNKVQKDLTSTQDIVKSYGVDFTSANQFLSFLNRIDFGLLSTSMKSVYADGPASLLTDIIAAAETNDDNLLDCY